MFKFYTLVITVLISSMGLNAQISEKEYRFSDGIQNALMVELPGSSSKTVSYTHLTLPTKA